MNYSDTFARLRKKSGLTQPDVAEYISKFSVKPCSFKIVSHWEKGYSLPTVDQFLLLCELYEVKNIQKTFRGIETEFQGFIHLNDLGKNRVEEYISLLVGNPLFSVVDNNSGEERIRRLIKLYDAPVAAGTGLFLDSDEFIDFEVDDTVPNEADFAVRVSGDSMFPRFVDTQIVFIKEQDTLDPGEIGIFAVNGDAYIKKLGNGELLSLNSAYSPIKLHEYDSISVFGKVIG